MKKIFILGVLFIFGISFVAGCGTEEPGKSASPEKNTASGPTFAAIGTASNTGNYYLAGQAIAELVNRNIDENKIRCTVEVTTRSVFNVNAVMAGDLKFGIVQSDSQWAATQGKKEWKEKGPQADLRSVFSIYPEAVTLVAAVDAGIKTIMDLKGKRVNIGHPGSGQRQNAIDALEAVNIDYKTDMNAEGVKASESAGLLQDGRIDAFFFTVGHPSSTIREATNGRRKVRFGTISGIDGLLKKHPFYTKALIRADSYPGAANKEMVETFSVRATLVTSAQVPDSVVYALTRAVFENFEDFKSMNPTLNRLTKPNMLTGLSAPLHSGALRYYREANLK